MRRTGIYGGTFNPVHSGHLLLARTYIERLSLDRLLVIPTNLPPHKSGEALIDGAHRLRMCELAFAGEPRCEASDIELQRPAPSYTVDTLEQLAAPDEQLFLAMGGDMFLSFTEWRNWRRIAELAVLCVGAREPHQDDAIACQAEMLTREGARCEILAFEPLPISSTEIREMAARHQPLDDLVPAAVAAYIADNRLYQADSFGV